MKKINLSVPNLSMDIVKNLEECIATGWVSTGGRFITEFEDKIAKYVDVENAVSVQSGTGGLHTALRVLGVEQGDEVIVPTLTFIAAVNPVTYLGATPVFMDCDSTLNMDLNKLRDFFETECELKNDILYNKSTNRKIRAIVIVHVFGNLVDMDFLAKLARKYNVKILEDATEALGSYYTEGTYKGRFAGTIGDMGVYSFNANKIITTGGGGMIVSKNDEYIEHARFLSIQAKTDSLYFVHDEIGYNYRMTNLQAALGTSQVDHLEGFIKAKIRNYNKYAESIQNIDGITLLKFNDGTRSNHWFYSILIDEEKYGIGRDSLLEKLIERGIQSRPIWKLCHLQKPYENNQSYQIEKSLFYVNNTLNIPCSSNITDEEIDYTINELKNNSRCINAKKT